MALTDILMFMHAEISKEVGEETTASVAQLVRLRMRNAEAVGSVLTC